MSTLGQFLEFSVQTSDVLESLQFYKTLGFVELEIGDVWTHKYAVVSDGELNIGLHDREFDSPRRHVCATEPREARTQDDGSRLRLQFFAAW